MGTRVMATRRVLVPVIQVRVLGSQRQEERTGTMKILEIRDTNLPDAHELPNKGRRPAGKQQKSPAGGNSGGHKTPSLFEKLPGKIKAELQKADQAQTAANKTVLWLVNGKLRLMREADYLRARQEMADA
jgi:hypothetical protein